MCSSALEAPLKRLDYKNRYKIKLLRLTFYTAGLSFFFFVFLFFFILIIQSYLLLHQSFAFASYLHRSAHPSGRCIDRVAGLSYSTWCLGEDACHGRYTID